LRIGHQKMFREKTHQAGQPEALIIPAETAIQKQAADYIEAGFALTNVDGKRPTARGWNKRSKAITSADKLSRITGNVGLLHAYSGTCCVDIDDYLATADYFEDNGLDLQALITADDAVLIDSGRENRAKLVYRTNQILPTIQQTENKTMLFELRCGDSKNGSVMDVLPPSIHPDTGKPYEWIGDWKRLPHLPTELASFWKQNTDSKKPLSVVNDEKNHRKNITSVGVPITSMGVSVQSPELHSIKSKSEARRLLQTEKYQRQILDFLGFVGFEGVFKTGRATVRSVVPPYDNNKSGGLIRTKNGEILFHDFPGACGNKHVPLQVLYARLIAGRFVRLTPTEKDGRVYGAVTLAVWGVQVLVDAGIVNPAIVDLPPCPPNSRKSMNQFYAGMKRLFEVRWAFIEHAGNPITMGREFMAPWCGLTENQARDAIKDLLKAGVIHTAGQHGRARLYAPGHKPPMKPKDGKKT